MWLNFLRKLIIELLSSAKRALLFLSVVILFITVLLTNSVKSQDYNPPYPRIGQMYLYHPGQGAEIWRNHDLIMIRHKYDESAREIKMKRPNVILMAANDYIVRRKNMWPDDWYIKCDHSASGGGGCNGGKLDSYHPDFGLMNITPESPMADDGYGSQKFNQFLPRYLVDRTDWNYFDGTIFDYWARQVWSGADIADINNDGRADGKDYVNQKWEEGNQELVRNLRSISDKPIMSNEGGRHQTYLNGNMFEFWSKNENKKHNINAAMSLLSQAVRPVIIYANSEVKEDGGVGAHWRADFALAQIGGAFIGHDEGTAAHRFTFLHDEYEADLGYPLPGSAGEPKELEPGLWVRYFDKGVVISNISGSSKTVTASQLTSGPYWRFRGGQDPNFNDGSQLTSVTFKPFDGIMLFEQPTTLATPIVIDNVKNNMTSLGQEPVRYSNNWQQVRWPEKAERSNTGYGLGIFWGDEENIYAITTGAGEATYQPRINIDGNYTIYEWHPNVEADGQGSGCSEVKVTINSANGTTSKFVDQTVNAGRWNSLGTYFFNKGNSGFVVITGQGGCTTASDAIRFVYLSSDVADSTPPDPPRGVRVEVN